MKGKNSNRTLSKNNSATWLKFYLGKILNELWIRVIPNGCSNSLNLRIPTLELRNGILLDPDGIDPQADITVSMNRATFNQLASTPDGLDKALDSGQAKLPKGQAPIYREFWSYFDNQVLVDRVSVR